MENTGRILRSKKNGKSRYTPINNDILQSKTLEPEEKSILVHLLSLPEDWVTYKTSIWKDMNIGRDRFNKHWAGLVKKGYINSIKVIKPNGQFAGYDHEIVEQPSLTNNQVTENQGTVNQFTDNQVTEIQLTGIQVTGVQVTEGQGVNKVIISESNNIENNNIESNNTVPKDINNSTINNIGNLDTIEDIIFWCSINDVSLGTNNPKYIIEDKWYLDKSYYEKELYLKKLTVQLQLN
jgi:hypothetical protein